MAARACGVDRIAGTLEAGKEADLLVVRGNPLEDVRRVRDVVAVLRGDSPIAPFPEHALVAGVVGPGDRRRESPVH